MSTLHQYRWLNINHCHQYLTLLDNCDRLVIYGDFTPRDQQSLLKKVPSLIGRCYWLCDAGESFSDIHNINHQQWLTLITEHDKTYTWK